jgi:hypothetical protein
VSHLPGDQGRDGQHGSGTLGGGTHGRIFGAVSGQRRRAPSRQSGAMSTQVAMPCAPVRDGPELLRPASLGISQFETLVTVVSDYWYGSTTRVRLMLVVDLPVTRYARTVDDVHIAYQVVGDGPFDLVAILGYVSHVELCWEDPRIAEFFLGLASFCRLILFDRRGLGLSDPVQGAPTLEDRMQDLCAVMNATGSQCAAVLGLSEGGPVSVLFAATYPERVTALILYGTFARMTKTDAYP